MSRVLTASKLSWWSGTGCRSDERWLTLHGPRGAAQHVRLIDEAAINPTADVAVVEAAAMVLYSVESLDPRYLNWVGETEEYREAYREKARTHLRAVSAI